MKQWLLVAVIGMLALSPPASQPNTEPWQVIVQHQHKLIASLTERVDYLESRLESLDGAVASLIYTNHQDAATWWSERTVTDEEAKQMDLRMRIAYQRYITTGQVPPCNSTSTVAVPVVIHSGDNGTADAIRAQTDSMRREAWMRQLRREVESGRRRP